MIAILVQRSIRDTLLDLEFYNHDYSHNQICDVPEL